MLGSRPLGFSVRVLRSRVLGGGAVVCGFTVDMFRAYPGIPQTGPEMSIRWDLGQLLRRRQHKLCSNPNDPRLLSSFLHSPYTIGVVKHMEETCNNLGNTPVCFSGQAA